MVYFLGSTPEFFGSNKSPKIRIILIFQNKLRKAQSSSELKSMAANKSLCPKMFEQWTIDRNTVGVKDSFQRFRQTGRVILNP